MRRFSLALIGSVFFAAPALAADPGTYRPGNSYNSVPANNADICKLQCSGDAQCRSWNFIRVSRMNEGVCEFNENNVSPVPSEISTSGQNITRRGSTQLIAGRTTTRRIGAPTQAAGPASVTQRSAARRVVREAVPARVQPRAANYSSPPRLSPAPAYAPAGAQSREHLSLTEQQNLNRQKSQIRPAAPSYAPPAPIPPQAPIYGGRNAGPAPAPRQMFRHSLEEGGAAPQRQIQPENSYAHADPRLAHRVQQARVSPSATAQMPAVPAAPYPRPQVQKMPAMSAPQGGLSAPPGVPPMAPSQQASYAPPPSQPSQPILAGPPKGAANPALLQRRAQAQAAAQRRLHIPSELAPRPMGAAEATQSLFGSLYDDVKIPAPIDPAQASDPNAPIPTVSSVPSGHIMSAPLPPVR